MIVLVEARAGSCGESRRGCEVVVVSAEWSSCAIGDRARSGAAAGRRPAAAITARWPTAAITAPWTAAAITTRRPTAAIRLLHHAHAFHPRWVERLPGLDLEHDVDGLRHLEYVRRRQIAQGRHVDLE